MKIPKIFNEILAFFAAIVIFVIWRLIWLTCSKEKLISPEFEELENSDKAFIYAFWHGRMYAFSFMRPKHRKVFVIVSRHGDGKMITNVMKLARLDAIRGSTNRAKGETRKKGNVVITSAKDRGGAAALRECVKTLKRGDCVAVTPDGPRGPRFIFKNNFLHVAALAEVPIVTGSFSASRAWVIPSWDKMIIPKPFAKIKIIYSELIYIPKKVSSEEMEKYGKQIEEELNNITTRLDGEFGIELD